METVAHKRPNYVAIWGYLFVLTVIEVAAALMSHIPKHWLILILLFLAIWKALLVAMYFMHLRFERWRLRVVFMVPLPLAAILVLATITEKIW
ncbi:MAG TPA: cytochrome C oxidase subunit IV family protein [Gemmatimonadales bacterium]|nr:cytochrome C oxidase subunit IV family protein [Gemmatimonadales bacterium]